MLALEFKIEWEDSHGGVRDAVLARTWARLEIVVAGQVVTRLYDTRTQAVREGVYGSVFPVAEWIVENWWSLTHESCRSLRYPGGRRLGGMSGLRWWVQRHSLLAAREGGSLPDLTFYRDEDFIVITWFPDRALPRSRPVQFITDHGSARLTPEEVEGAFVRLIEAVIDRLGDREDEDTLRLKSNWAAIKASASEEPRLCSWAASLGLDPYDPDELTEDLIQLFEAKLPALDAPLERDLLDTTTPQSLSADLGWVEDAMRAAPGARADPSIHHQLLQRLGSPKSRTAHRLGYRHAQLVRRKLFGLDPSEPLLDLPGMIHHALPTDGQLDAPISAPNERIDGLVSCNVEGGPLVVGPLLDPNTSRFRLARAFHFWLYSRADRHPRLLTRACTWSQRAARAFAAELLAPSEALRSLGSEGVVRPADVENMAERFAVSSLVVSYQVENHGIGRVEPG